MKAPCKNCTDRHQMCHSECERYKAFKEELDRANKTRFKENETHYLVSGYGSHRRKR